jgi:hypothetical protein
LKAQTHLPATPTLDVQTGLSRVQALLTAVISTAYSTAVRAVCPSRVPVSESCTPAWLYGPRMSMPMPGLYINSHRLHSGLSGSSGASAAALQPHARRYNTTSVYSHSLAAALQGVMYGVYSTRCPFALTLVPCTWLVLGRVMACVQGHFAKLYVPVDPLTSVPCVSRATVIFN